MDRHKMSEKECVDVKDCVELRQEHWIFQQKPEGWIWYSLLTVTSTDISNWFLKLSLPWRGLEN